MKLRPVNVTRNGVGQTLSIPADQVCDVVFGKNGNVTLMGGPTLRGVVSEGGGRPLWAQHHPEPEDMTPEQLERRRTIGRQIAQFANDEKPADPFGGDA